MLAGLETAVPAFAGKTARVDRPYQKFEGDRVAQAWLPQMGGNVLELLNQEESVYVFALSLLYNGVTQEIPLADIQALREWLAANSHLNGQAGAQFLVDNVRMADYFLYPQMKENAPGGSEVGSWAADCTIEATVTNGGPAKAV